MGLPGAFVGRKNRPSEICFDGGPFKGRKCVFFLGGFILAAFLQKLVLGKP